MIKEKKMKKKAISLLLASVMTAGMLAGCGSSAGTASAAGTATASSAGAASAAASGTSSAAAGSSASSADSGDSYEIVIEMMPGGTGAADLAEVEQAINDYVQPKINCTVKFMEIPIADHAQKIGLLTSSGEKMDIVIAGLTTSPSTLQASGVLMPFTKELEEYAPDLKKKIDPMISACTIKGDVYTIPMFLYNKKDYCFFYNKDLADQNKLTFPESVSTAEDLASVFKTIKDSGISSSAISFGDGTTAMPLSGDIDPLGDVNNQSYGVLLDPTKDTTIVNFYDTDRFEQICKTIRDWYNAGYVEPDSLSSGNNMYASLSSAKSLGNISALGAGGTIDVSPMVGGLQLGTVKIDTQVPLTTASINDYCYGISSNCQNLPKVMQFLNLMYTDSTLMNLMNYGIEGKHYVKSSDNIITYPDGVNVMNVGYGSFINKFGDESLYYHFAPQTEDYYANLKNYSTDSAVKSKAFGYTFDASSVKTQLAAVSSVISTYRPSLECGIADVDQTLAEFREALKSAGIDEIVAENQKQFDAWLAEQK